MAPTQKAIDMAMDPKCGCEMCGTHCGHGDWAAAILREALGAAFERIKSLQEALASIHCTNREGSCCDDPSFCPELIAKRALEGKS